MVALVIGATGATGFELVKQLLDCEDFEKVLVFVRKAFPLSHPKLIVHQVDFDKPDEWRMLIMGDIAYSCMGTTLKVAGSKEKQWCVDYSYQLEFAKNCSTNKVPKFVLLSATGANPNSKMFYSRMKGELEEAVMGLSFQGLIIMQPGLLSRPNSDRMGEKLAEKMILGFNTIGLLKKYKPLAVRNLASKMLTVSIDFAQGGVMRVVDFA